MSRTVELFNNLMSVVEKSEKANFYFKDVITSMGTRARVFSYFIASYSDWLHEDALECRGIMFELDDKNEPVRIMSRPMQKFFNLKECPFTIGLDLTKMVQLMDKADGSLVSSYLDKGYLFLKSKTAVMSDQAQKATALLNSPKYENLHSTIKLYSQAGYTVNMEYVGPNNRIVLGYEEEKLIVLNIRHNETGEYAPASDLFASGSLRPHVVTQYRLPDWKNISPDEWEANIRAQTEIEGVIGVLSDGKMFKLKTDWYSALHRTKDSINNNKALFQSIKERASDDLRGLFADDQVSLTKLEAFESAYIDTVAKYHKMCADVWYALQGKDRRTFAIEAQTMLKDNRYLFTVVMQQYGRDWDGELAVEKIEEHIIKEYAKYVPLAYR